MKKEEIKNLNILIEKFSKKVNDTVKAHKRDDKKSLEKYKEDLKEIQKKINEAIQ